MVRSNIPAGFCVNCSGQIFAGQKYCHQCGKLIAQNVEPTSPRIIPKFYKKLGYEVIGILEGHKEKRYHFQKWLS